MRISGGQARGTRLIVPAGARPASERVRQAVFNALGPRVLGARVADLFCGSGAYGLEALSRGAEAAVFVDESRAATRAARANARAAGLGDPARFVTARVQTFLARKGGPFDLVFVDPPYGSSGGRAPRGDQAMPAPAVGVLEGLADALSDGATVVIEQRFRRAEAPKAPGYVLEADRRYGDTRVLTYRRESQ